MTNPCQPACAQAVTRLLKDARRREIRSAGRGSKGDRWYAWAWLGIASPRHHLLMRRCLRTGELAFHHCYVPVEEDLCATRRLCAVRRWESKEVRDLLAGLSQQPGRSRAQSDPGDAGEGGKQR